MKLFEIRDWMDNLCFKGATFDSFEDAWGYIHSADPKPEEYTDDNWYDDYYVLPIKEGGTK